MWLVMYPFGGRSFENKKARTPKRPQLFKPRNVSLLASKHPIREQKNLPSETFAVFSTTLEITFCMFSKPPSGTAFFSISCQPQGSFFETQSPGVFVSHLKRSAFSCVSLHSSAFCGLCDVFYELFLLKQVCKLNLNFRALLFKKMSLLCTISLRSLFFFAHLPLSKTPTYQAPKAYQAVPPYDGVLLFLLQLSHELIDVGARQALLHRQDQAVQRERVHPKLPEASPVGW